MSKKSKDLNNNDDEPTCSQQKAAPEPDDEPSSPLLDTLSTVTDNLDTYPGRDTMLTLMHYLALIFADMCTYYEWGVKQNMSENFVNMFIALSNCRVMLRLFDDFGAIREYYRFRKAEQKNV